MNRKIITVLSILLLVVISFLFVSCQKNDGKINIKASLLVENANKKDNVDKLLIVEKKISFEENDLKNKDIDFSSKGKIYREVTKYFNSINYELRDNSIEISKDKRSVSYFLHLKENKLTINEKNYVVKALTPFSLKNLSSSYDNKIFFDEKNGKYYNSNQMIILEKDMSLKIIDFDESHKKFYDAFDKSIYLLSNTYKDKVLKGHESYPKDLKYIDSLKYLTLEIKFKETLNSFSKNLDNKVVLLSELVFLNNQFEESIVIGTKENDFSKDYFELKKKELNDNYLESLKFVKKHVVIDEEIEPSQLKQGVTHILKKDLIELSKRILSVNLLIINSSFDDANNKKNIENINKMIIENEKLKDLMQNSKIITGTKVVNPLNYVINFYYDGVLKDDEKTIITGDKGDFVFFSPTPKEGYDIDHNSKLSGVLNDDSLVLEVKYVKKVYFITIDLNKGQILNFDKKHIEVKHGEKIPQEYVDKLISITRKNDNFGDNYVFEKYINYYTKEDFDFNAPITKPSSLRAVFTFEKRNINYKIRVYKDQIIRNVLDPVYNGYSETLSELVEKGSPLYYIPEVPEGFELDLKFTKNSFNSVTEETIVEIYLKRKLVRIDLSSQTNILTFNDDRVVKQYNSGSLTLKYGQVFDFVLTGIEFEKVDVQGNKKNQVLYKVYNNGEEFLFKNEQVVKENMALDLVTRVSEKSIYKVIANYSFLGSKKYENEKAVNIERISFVESGEKIVDKAFFAPDVESSKAIFDLSNEKGYVANLDYTKFDFNQSLPNISYDTEKRLIFVYNMNYEQAHSILVNEHYGNELPMDTYREIEGTIVAKYNNLYMLEINDSSNKIIPIRVDRNLTLDEENSLTIGNLVKINLVLVENYSKYIKKDSKYNFNLGRLGGLVGLVKNSLSKISLKTANYKTVNKTILNNFDDINYGKVKVNNLYVIEKSKSNADVLENYDSENSTKYYYIKVRDINNKVGYVFLAENSSNIETFKNINIYDTISVDEATLMLAKAKFNDNEIESFYESSYENRPSLFILDGSNVTVDNANSKTVKINFIFHNEEQEFVKYTNIFKDIKISRDNTIQNAISAAFEKEFFNSYKIREVRVNNEAVSNLSKKINDINAIDVHMEKANSYIEFLLVTYLPYEMKENLKLKVTTGGITYVTSPVDIDGYVVKFILNYNKLDYFIDISVISLHYTLTDETNPNKYVIKIDDEFRNKDEVYRYVAYEGGRYNPITGLFGLPEKAKIGYQYAAQHPFKVEKGETGLFFDAYTTNKGPMPDEAFRKFHERVLYSEKKGFVETDGPDYSNMEWNRISVYSNSQTQFFVRVGANEDGSYKTNEEINNDKSIDFKLVASISHYEILEDGTNKKTNKKVEYKFHKGSLTNYIKINKKYHIGVLHIDVNTNLADNKTVFNLNGTDLLDKKYLLNDKTSRIKTDKIEYFEDLNKDGLYINGSPIDIKQQDQFLIRTYINYTFTIEDSDYHFEDGSNLQTIKAYYKEKFTLNILIPDNKKIEIYDQNGLKIENYSFMYNDSTEFKNFSGDNHRSFKVKIVDK